MAQQSLLSSQSLKSSYHIVWIERTRLKLSPHLYTEITDRGSNCNSNFISAWTKRQKSYFVYNYLRTSENIATSDNIKVSFFRLYTQDEGQRGRVLTLVFLHACSLGPLIRFEPKLGGCRNCCLRSQESVGLNSSQKISSPLSYKHYCLYRTSDHRLDCWIRLPTFCLSTASFFVGLSAVMLDAPHPSIARYHFWKMKYMIITGCRSKFRWLNNIYSH